MSKGFKLLRIEYIFSVLIPCLLSIYLNDYDIGSQIWILTGFAFYAITGNTLNDVIDMKDPNEKETLERVEGYGRKRKKKSVFQTSDWPRLRRLTPVCWRPPALIVSLILRTAS